MKLRILVSAILLTASLLAAGVLFLTHRPIPATAAPATGSVTGQVVWNAPVPIPYGVAVPGAAGQSGIGQASPGEVAPVPSQSAPDAPTQVAPDAVPLPDTAPDTSGAMPAPGIPIRPIPRQPRLIPAGAVLVAIQGTNLSARTDDQGRFRIDNVPTGQYLTLAAGPVQGITTAVAVRPNVYVQEDGGTVDIGRLYLGQSYGSYGPIPYVGAPGAAAPDTTGNGE